MRVESRGSKGNFFNCLTCVIKDRRPSRVPRGQARGLTPTLNLPVIVIIEGPDGAGKTTLAKTLDGVYRHVCQPSSGNALPYYLELLRTPSPRVIFDRFAWSETIFGPLLRDRDGLGPRGFDKFESVRRMRGAIVVMCLPPVDECLQNWQRKLDAGYEIIHDRDIFLESYHAFANLAPMADIIHDYTRT